MIFCYNLLQVHLINTSPLHLLHSQYYPYLKKPAMSLQVTRFGLSPSVICKPDTKLCHPVSPMIPKFSSKFLRLGRICASGTGSSSITEGKETAEIEHYLKPLWDDGYGAKTMKDYVEGTKDTIQPDDGPLSWFCPSECGTPLEDSPVLLYLPGVDGDGTGLVMHHKALGKVFNVRCMQIPIQDRTPYEGLVKFVEDAVKAEYALFPNRPIYLVGESFGGCLALSVAAANPTIDLVLVLVNPATSFGRSQLPSLLTLLEAVPEEFHSFLPNISGTALGDLIKMVKISDLSSFLQKQLGELFFQSSALANGVTSKPDISLMKTLTWKLRLLKTAAALSNSHLDAVKAEVLIVASGKDSLLPSESEGIRLSNLLINSKGRLFKNNGHNILLEDGVNLLSVIKATLTYRRSRTRHIVKDYIPGSMSEYKLTFEQYLVLYNIATSPVALSTLADGKIVRGLEGIPDQGPVLLVGYHMLFGADLHSIVQEFQRDKKTTVHGLAHPRIYVKDYQGPLPETSFFDTFKLYGAVPTTGKNLYTLLRHNRHVFLFPGGANEALHVKGEEYKLTWPDEAEFVRMAMKFGAKIVPFGAVGEDDLIELFIDHKELMNIPLVKDLVKSVSENFSRAGAENQADAEASDLNVFIPGFYPKVPGRIYHLYGKAIKTKGMEDLINDTLFVKQLYQQVKSEVENCMAYLLKKREEDPNRHLFNRMIYHANSTPLHEIPTFDP